MKGFDYSQARPVNLSIPQWRTLAKEATRRGGQIREDRRMGETFIHGPQGMVAEIYGINLKLGDKHGRE